MNISTEKHFNTNFKDILIDEIALNGLEGIGFNLLWNYVEKRISSRLTDKMKKRFWGCITNAKCISFYQAPGPTPCVDVVDRFLLIDELSGQLLDPPEYLDGPYEYHLVENEYGSCSNYDTRVFLKKETILSMTYEEVVEKYGNTLVMVASIEERWHALVTHMPFTLITQLTPIHYCILELVGKGRENGQMTVGKTNLTKIIKESKLLFYNRKHLQKLDLIRVQCLTQVTQGRGIKSLLLRLKRFHQIRILSMPKVGKLHKLIEYLLSKPDYSERCDILMRKGFLTQPECKKLKKTINVFRFNDKEVTEEKSSGDKKKHEKISNTQKRKFMCLTPSDDESSPSDDDSNEVALECQYKVGVNILRQAYELFLEAGLKGLTQVEMAQLLGIEFYTSRTICRGFRAKNIVREFLEDKGRQRTARYIAVAATAEMDSKYAEEKNKLLQYFSNTEPSTSKSDEGGETDGAPAKKIKLEHENKNTNEENIDDKVLEVKVLDGLQKFNHESLLNSRKSLSLRQLRFANGLLNVLQEKQAVGGYQTLSTLVAERTGEPPMDTKALKLFVQKLVTDGQLKILKIKWPGFHQKYSVLICAANVKSSSPVIKAKYKDICLKSVVSRKSKGKNFMTENITRPLSQFAYPRYMKIQKLHELITQLVFFNALKVESYSFPAGVSSLLTIMPEMTIEFALGNISNVGSSDIAHLKVNDDLLKIKLRDAPADLYRAIIQSRSMQNSIRNGLRVLAQLGLVQFLSSLNHVQNAKQNVFYVNRYARIIDTTGDWPRKNVDLKALEKTYDFQTIDDVKTYWDDVYSISINTDIILEKRERYHAIIPTRKESEVEQFDTGVIFGDGQGPCGFHSNVFMDIPRLWNTLYLRNSKFVKTKKIKRKHSAKAPKVEKLKNKKHKLSNRKVVRKPVVEPSTAEKVPKTRHSDTHIKWTPLEDEILVMCKAAITIMSPNSQAGCLKIKNIVARHLLSIHDPKKTGRICHRRGALLESNPKYSHRKDCIINESRRHRHLIQKYEDLLRKLKIRHCANMTKYINEGRLLMLELVWIISQILKRGISTHSVPCIAADYDEFNKKYTIASSSTNKSFSLYKTSITSDPVFATLKEGIIQTVMLSYNRDLEPKTAKKIYCVFEDYSEELLRSAIEQLRKSSALAAKEKVLNNQMNRVQFNDIVRSSFKISASYKRKWISRLNSDFVENLVSIMDSELSQTCIKGSPGINCVLFEMHSVDVLDIISVTVPVIVGSSGNLIQEEQLNVIDIEMKFKLKSGVAGWRNKCNVKKNLSEIFEKCSVEKYLAKLHSVPVVEYIEDQVIDLTDPIISYLNDRQENGSTFRDLQVHLGWDDQTLQSMLLDLEEQDTIKRVGYFENRIVLMKYLKPWLFSINKFNTFVIPNPWITLDLEIRYDVLLNWAGVIMNKVFECPGSSIVFLSEHTEYLSTRSIQEISTFLEKIECVKLKNIELREVDLFSDDDYVPEVTDFNPYESPDNILVFPAKNCLTKYAYIRKKILDMIDTD
ncbi:uncharacterized protein [Epargyreus clarus]|uniref:uncharacterized protein n=1 Tax=Epargyreus clarus TaxID=520877 RepID=UPI003C2B7A7A